MARILFLFVLCILLSQCQDGPVFTPKPRAFPKVNYPEKQYQDFDQDYCKFTFSYPAYARIEQTEAYFEEAPVDPCWFDIYIPEFDSRLHCSYYPIGPDKDFETLKKDAFKLADWHNKKANFIDELIIQKENNVSGFAFDIEGPAASPFQFFVTDSTQHFLRGALYFNTEARPDSLAPIVDFVKEDILKIIETFRWTE